MTIPAMPIQGSTNWYAWIAALDRAARTVVDLRQYGVVGDGTTDDTAAIQAAADAAAASGACLTGNGTFRINSTVFINCNCDLRNATFWSYVSGVAIQFGTSAAYIHRLNVAFPRVICKLKVTNGWVAGTSGINIINANTCNFLFNHIQGFETGLTISGLGGAGYAGVQFNVFTMGHLDNNKVSLRLTLDLNGWVNQNTFLGGRWSHNSNESGFASGTRHIRFDDKPSGGTNAPPNGNVFLNASLESTGFLEYAIDMQGGQYNLWTGLRLEIIGGGGQSILWGASAKRNWIVGAGQGMETVTETHTAGSTLNCLLGQNNHRILSSGTRGGLVTENSSGATSPAWTVTRAGGIGLADDPNVKFAWRCSEQYLEGRRSTESFDRIKLDATNGRTYLGDGTADPVVYLSGGVNGIIVSGGALFFLTDNTQDIGSTTSLRPRYIRAATAVQTGAAVTGSRPAAATARAGAMFYDTTLSKPIWSDGTVWRDATGTSV